MGGYVGASQTENVEDQPYATITYRIPADRWEDALDLLRGLNGLTSKVVGEQTQAVEVTGQVIDLEARIRNLRASETALQEIASTATRITDVLEVQNQLTNVRGQIEQLSAALADLEDRAGFATLTATFSMPVVAVDCRGRLRAAAGRGRGDRQPGEHPAGADDGRDLVRDRVAAAAARARRDHRDRRVGRPTARPHRAPARRRRATAGMNRSPARGTMRG